ncbi:GLPGLI family protein [Chitinophaga silvatica]|uniref:GLPGLI family protein n=1 Tax=Chitinophaga silvatica TaxID=2282649 RepID=A0A3E1Y6E2_9BACT|nr:GLPGLI family protein [Chitinophaga silvatica]RFS20487.1 GLPGLI family protein [Chitinophaga silvatica]
MQRIFRVFFLVIFLVQGASAQMVTFLKKGHIEYERRINLHARMYKPKAGEENSFFESMKANTPQFSTTYFDFYFDGNVSLYKPVPANSSSNPFFSVTENTVYTMLDSMKSISQKKIFDQQVLITDSVRQIKWKITNETRKIAGFDCRRANAIIMDSIYVVAFYTDAIIPGGGPESFTGLPGAILGLALPHEHITWFATKVLLEEIKEGSLKPPTKGKAMNNKGAADAVSKAISRWGGSVNAYLKDLML